ncbi:MAG: cell division protein FtsW, partial [Alphaproteobacteria bacterium]|nr:cell division protein FtsW [Alphaproteobacteria bacterium]
FMAATGLWAITAALLLAQPDVGMALVVTAVWGAQFFMAGLPLALVVALCAAGIGGLYFAYLVFPHVAARIDRFLDPGKGDHFQVERALDAFQSGGLIGRGPGEGVVKRVIPDAHTDFIFAVAGEEFGAALCVVLILLFAFIVLRGFFRLFAERDYFVLLAAAGLLVQFGLQAAINMGVNLRLLPTKGMTLPFISYGGSSLLALALGMGMVLALTRRAPAGSAAP